MPILPVDLTLTSIADIAGDESPSKRKLIDAGERLMGIHGIDAPTLQAIAVEAGQANKYAVQYHFGGRDGLIDAIFAVRMRQIRMRRAYLIDLIAENGLDQDLSALIEAVFIPMSEQIDDEGRHSYARFLLQYTSRAGFDPSRPDDPFNLRRGLVVDLMRRMTIVLEQPFDQFELRFFQMNVAMMIGLIARDNLFVRRTGVIPLERIIDDTIAMAVPALWAASARQPG